MVRGILFTVPGAIACLSLCLAIPLGSHANDDGGTSPLEPADTSSPRAAISSFFNSCDELYGILRDEVEEGRRGDRTRIKSLQTRILRHLDLAELSGISRTIIGAEAALALKEVIDRIEHPPMDEIPDVEDLSPDGEYHELTRWTIPGTEIILEKVLEGPREGEWLFSEATVLRAPEFYSQVKHLPYREGATKQFMDWYLNYPGPMVAPIVNVLPNSFRTRVGERYAVWQWIGLTVSVLFALTLMLLIYRLGKKRSLEFRGGSPVRYLITLGFPLIAVFIPIFTNHFIRHQIRISGTLYEVIAFCSGLLCLFTIMAVILGLGSRIAEFIISSPKIQPKGLDAQLIRVLTKVLSLVAATIVFLEGGKFLGIPLSTLLASAGIGGVAFALAAQDSLKNLFGSMMILLDKPARLGERVLVKGYDGVVDEIGLRSTKLRLLNGNIAYIPNHEMAASDIENVARREHIKRVTDIRIPIDTPSEKTEKALEIVRNALDSHEGMHEDFPPRVYFIDYVSDAQLLRMIYWYHPPNYWDYLAFGEKLNLRIAKEFEAAGIQFALPSSETRFVGKSPEENSSSGALKK